ncbi:MAG: hypothetical protein ACMXYD_05795 [Candidatus Woesearchaeota archaeon]
MKEETLSRAEALQALKLIKELLAKQNIQTNEELIPASIYNNNLSPFQALATHLHNTGKTTKEIARQLGRSKQFVQESIHEQKLDTTGTPLPISIYRENLSVLEATTHELHKQGKNNKQIAAETGKSTSSVWIALNRAKKKLRGETQ